MPISPDTAPFSDPNVETNGDVPGVKEGVQQPSGVQEAANIDLPQYKEMINEKLIAEIEDKITQIDPKIFQGIVAELAELMEEFKGNLSQLQMLQFTSPDAYNNILSIFQTLTTLAQIMLVNGDLPTDQDVVSQQVAQQIQDVAGAQSQEQPSSGGGEQGDDGVDGRNTAPIGTIKWVNVNGTMRPRVKTADGWKYATSGFGGSAGRPAAGG